MRDAAITKHKKLIQRVAKIKYAARSLQKQHEKKYGRILKSIHISTHLPFYYMSFAAYKLQIARSIDFRLRDMREDVLDFDLNNMKGYSLSTGHCIFSLTYTCGHCIFEKIF